MQFYCQTFSTKKDNFFCLMDNLKRIEFVSSLI